jgi:hypothetical protein
VSHRNFDIGRAEWIQCPAPPVCGECRGVLSGKCVFLPNESTPATGGVYLCDMCAKDVYGLREIVGSKQLHIPASNVASLLLSSLSGLVGSLRQDENFVLLSALEGPEDICIGGNFLLYHHQPESSNLDRILPILTGISQRMGWGQVDCRPKGDG